MVERTEMLTVVVSVYNEEAALPLCHERLTEVLRESGRDYTLLFVNDGSRDRSAYWTALRRKIRTCACFTFRETSVMRPR